MPWQGLEQANRASFPGIENLSTDLQKITSSKSEPDVGNSNKNFKNIFSKIRLKFLPTDFNIGTFIKMMFPDQFSMLSKFSRMETLAHEIAILWRNNSKQNAKASNIYAMFSAQKRHLFILDLTLTFKSKSRISGLLEKYCSKFQYSFGGFKWEMSKSLSYI